MGPVPSLTLSSDDAWVFVAIAGDANKPVALQHVVSSLDYLNRAMPTEKEFERAVTRLVRAGFVAVTQDGFAATPDGARVFDAFGKEGVINIMFELGKTWNGKQVADYAPAYEYRLKAGEWERAQAAYHKWFKDWMDKRKAERAETDDNPRPRVP
jgi:hypothetical protein